METDYTIKLKIGKWFLAKRFDLHSNPKYKHLYYFIGKRGIGCYAEIFKF